MLEKPRRTEPEAPAGEPPPLPAHAALFLDFDGSLVELAERPDLIAVAPGLPALLDAVAARLGGALAIVTGRRLADIDARLAPLRPRGAGAHGSEWRGGGDAAPRVLEVAGASGIVRALRQRFAGDPRVIVEDKGAVVALHFRQAPERAEECTDALRALVSCDPELEMIGGNKVVEARPRGVNKGAAVRRLLREAPFAARTPIVVGDDVSDEAAFAVARELGGYGIKVGVGPTQARYRLADVGAVHEWLDGVTHAEPAPAQAFELAGRGPG